MNDERNDIMTNPNGRFGEYGGQYMPETLMNAVIELEEAYTIVTKRAIPSGPKND